MNDGVVQEKTNNGRTTWIVQRNEEKTTIFQTERKKIIYPFEQICFPEWTNVLKILTKTIVFTKRTIFWNKLSKTIFFNWTNDFTEQIILLNRWFYWTDYFTLQMILLNRWFYWTDDFTLQMILLNRWFYWTDDFTLQMILQNRWFYWTDDFTEQMILLNRWFYWIANLLNRWFYFTDNFYDRTILLNSQSQ